MSWTSVADQDFLGLYVMTTTSIGRTCIDGMAVVKATADSIPFDDLEAHDGNVCFLMELMRFEMSGGGALYIMA